MRKYNSLACTLTREQSSRGIQEEEKTQQLRVMLEKRDRQKPDIQGENKRKTNGAEISQKQVF